MKHNNNNLRRMEYEANNNLLDYEGDMGDLALMDSYLGDDDDMLDFGGINLNFATEIGRGRVFNITLTNTAVATRFAFISPGLVYVPGSELDGVIRTGAFSDRDGNAGLSGAGSPQSIEFLLSFFYGNPTRFGGFKISSDTVSGIEQIYSLIPESPFRTLESDEFILSSYTDENNFKDKVVTVPRDFQMDNQSKFLVVIPASTIITITLFGGSVLNAALALDKKASVAKRNIASIGAGNAGRIATRKRRLREGSLRGGAMRRMRG